MTTHSMSPTGDIVGTRISVYDLLPQFLDATATEDYLCRMYDLTREQVAAARAYIFNNLETVLSQHLKIEARIAAGNPPDVVQHAEKTRAAMQAFKVWLAEQTAQSESTFGQNGTPNFREWLAQKETLVGEDS